MKKTNKITLTALFVAIGIVLPQSLHLFGGSNLGSILLPMHLPIFIGAMLLGPLSGVIIALASLLIGVAIGMPSIVFASYMIFELLTYGFVSGYLYHNKKVNVVVSYIIAKVAGMGVAILVINLLINLFHTSFPPIFGSVAMFAAGIPGIIIQCSLIIVLVPILDRHLKLKYNYEKK